MNKKVIMKTNSTQIKPNTSQKDDSSFSFNFTKKSKTQPKGTVFKKKTLTNNDNKQEGNDESNKNVFQDKFKSGYVKRKQRKDKLLVKQGVNIEAKDKNQNQKKNFSLFADRKRDFYVDSKKGESISEVVFTKGTKFNDLGIHKHLVSNLEKINFNVLTNVQEKSIPVLLEKKNALIRSQTGSGKTLAYAVPILNRLLELEPRLKRTDGIQVLIVVPTRELALQTNEEFKKINTFQWIVTGYLCGGESRKSEKDRIRKGVNILIGTPGRILDHVLHTSALDLSKIKCVVLDEADRLLDMGFRKDILSLIEKIDSSKIHSDYNPIEMLFQKSQNDNKVTNKEYQTILLSATLTKDIAELADLTMKDHVSIDALDETQNVNENDFIIPKTVTQECLIVPIKHRLFTLSSMIVSKSKKNAKIFIFMASTHMVEFHYELFSKHLVNMPKNRGRQKTMNFNGENVVVFDDSDDESDDEELVVDVEFFKLHGNMDQKERKDVFVRFKNARKGVLICTDVAARGLDVPEADLIIQYTPPQTDKDYLHRIGRTGRAGKSGIATIFLTPEEQEYISYLNNHKVFLKKKDTQEYLRHLCDVMREKDVEEAATALQRHFENVVNKNGVLKKSACFAYSTWSRFYNSYSSSLKSIFNYKQINLGHYVTSFALTITPTEVSGIVRGQIGKTEKTRLNKKLANHA
nr:probable ATP-dependent RNA helicase CG8611 [Onthophagus taurus]